MVSLLALLLQVAAPAAPVLAADETLLQVEAEGSVCAVPDTVDLTAGASADGASSQAALAALARTATRLIDAARAAGVAPADIRTTDLSIARRFAVDSDGDETDRVIGFRASSRVRVRIRQIARASTVLDMLVKAGATDVGSPEFSFADEAPLLRAARIEAVRGATRKGNDYATALNKRVTRTLRVSERRAVADGGADIVVTGTRRRADPLVPIEPGEQEVKVTVWIDFALAAAR